MTKKRHETKWFDALEDDPWPRHHIDDYRGSRDSPNASSQINF